MTRGSIPLVSTNFKIEFTAEDTEDAENRNYKLRRFGWFAFLCSCLATRALRHKEKIRAETINSGQ